MKGRLEMGNKLNALQRLDDYDAHIRHLQVIYLNKHNFDIDSIIEWTGYAKSTIKIYLKKFSNLIDEANALFYHITRKAKEVIQGKKELAYLFKFYDKENKLICSKVGTTTRLPETRLAEEIKYYRKHNIEVAYGTICSVIDCGHLPAEGAESITRAHFIKKYPTAFCKNDRFFGVDISTRVFNRIVTEYLK